MYTEWWQIAISKSGNSQITAHISVSDSLAEKAEWYQEKTQTQSVAFLQKCNGFTPLFMTNESQGLGEPLVNL